MATGDVAAPERATRSEPSPSGRMEEDVVELQQGDDAAEEPEPKRLRRSERRKSQDGGGVVQEPAVDAVDLTGDTDDDDEVEVVRMKFPAATGGGEREHQVRDMHGRLGSATSHLRFAVTSCHDA